MYSHLFLHIARRASKGASMLVALCLLSPAWQVVAVKAQEKPGAEHPPEAVKALLEGKQLLEQGTADSMRRAIGKLEEALKIFHDAKDVRGEANTLGILSEIFNSLGENQKALQYLDRALPLMKAAGDATGEALLLVVAGNVANSIGEKRKALDYFSGALPRLREIKDQDAEASTLNNLASVYDDLGEPAKAFETYEQALKIRRALGDTKGEAEVLLNVGVVYLQQNDYQKALDIYSQVLPLMRKAGNKEGEGAALINLGLLYKFLGEREKSLGLFNQALPLLRAIGRKDKEVSALSNIGALYNESGDQQKAVEAYERALSLAREVGDKVGESRTLVNLGNAYRVMGQLQKSVETHRRALLLMREMGDKNGEAGALDNLAVALARLGDRPQAMELTGQSLALRRATGDIGGQARLLNNLAVMKRDAGDADGARQDIEAALGLVESLRARYTNQNIRTQYFASVKDYYDFYIDLLMRLHKQRPSSGYDAAALQASERARALLDLLAEAGADIRQGIDPKMLDREKTLRGRLNELAGRQRNLTGGPHDEAQATAFTRSIEDVTTALQQLEAESRQTSPAYAALTQPRPLTVREIQTQVLDADTVLLEYALGEERSFLWVVTEGTIESFELRKREEIEAVASEAYELLRARGRVLKGEAPARRDERIRLADVKYAQTASRLSGLILPPAGRLPKGKRLLIVADGALQYIPFAALPGPAKNPLIVSHELITLPSASVIASLRQQQAVRGPSGKLLAVLADPVFENDDVRIRGNKAQLAASRADARDGSGGRELAHTAAAGAAKDVVGPGDVKISRLAGTRQEAEQILALVPEAERMVALDFAANRAAATSPLLSQYRYVHFATHGFLDSRRPELSGIVLSMFDEAGTPQDGFLRAHEVFNLKLPADLVVLSACETGLGKEIRGEGLLGLTRGFMYAGAQRVAVSLWGVSDAGTADLMSKFYRGMIVEKRRPAEALRAAQLELRGEKKYNSPFYWAAFTLQGEWR